jgi:benzoyl-CoA reductase/2-hydroxyglutaryl-CoA dehydratase subunit BcrC/BadD/HgdB
VGRRVRRRRSTAGPILRRAGRRLLRLPPCPPRAASQAGRVQWLLRRFEASAARGLLIHELKFCEPELFDVPAIRKAFAARSVPVLYVEGELELELSGQTRTRLEAFVELLAGRARA